MSRPRIAVVGAGAWGMNHVRAVASETRCELAAIVDVASSARSAARALVPDAVLYEAADGVLADPAIDAIVVATPSSTHADLCVAALRHGKHVLVEKPLALRVADATRVRDAARETDRIAMVGHLLVYHPAVTRLRALLATGDMGPVRYVRCTRANLGRIRSDESVLWSFGPHELSVLGHLLQREPRWVSARHSAYHHPGVSDVVFMTLDYGDGLVADVFLSRVHPRKERVIDLVLDGRMLQFDDVAQDKLRIYETGIATPPAFTRFDEYLTIRDGDVHVPRVVMEEPLRAQLRHFLDCIRDQRAPMTDLASGVRSIEVLEAAERSIRDGGHRIPLESQ